MTIDQFANLVQQTIFSMTIFGLPAWLVFGSIIAIRIVLEPFLGKDGFYILQAFIIVAIIPSAAYIVIVDRAIGGEWPTQWPLAFWKFLPFIWLALIWCVALQTKLHEAKASRQ